MFVMWIVETNVMLSYELTIYCCTLVTVCLLTSISKCFTCLWLHLVFYHCDFEIFQRCSLYPLHFPVI